MGNIPEPRTKIWVSRDRTVQIHEFEPVKLSAGVQQAYEGLRTGKEISGWMREMESVVLDSLDRQEAVERLRKTPIKPEPVTPKTVSVPKKVEQKNLNNVKKTEEGWIPTKNPNIEMKKASDGGLDFHDIKTGETWHKNPKNSPK